MIEKNLTKSQKQSLSNETARNREQYLNPAVDIFETEEALTLVADLPGVGRDDLEIGVHQGILTLEASTGAVGEEEQLHGEFAIPGYHRQFKLSDKIDATRAEAEMSDGVLTLTLPKAEAAKPRRIEVKTVH